MKFLMHIIAVIAIAVGTLVNKMDNLDNQKNNYKFLIIFGIIIVVVILLIIFLFIGNKKNESKNHEVSIFDCLSENELIKNRYNDPEFLFKIGANYFIYVYKTNQPSKVDKFINLLPEKLGNFDNSITREEIKEDVKSFIANNDYQSKYFRELNIVKNKEIPDDINLTLIDPDIKDNYENLVIFSKSNNIEDCKNIKIYPNNSFNSLLLVDTCILTYSYNKNNYCRNL